MPEAGPEISARPADLGSSRLRAVDGHRPHTSRVPEPTQEDGASRVAWKRLRQNRHWYSKLSSEPLAEAKVDAPSGRTYLVRVRKNAAVVGLGGVDGSDVVSTAFDLLKANLDAAGDTGWRIDVLAPASGWRREEVLYTQHVGAKPIVVDVILAITNALERGDILWPEEEE
jgi:hypothetical protein